MSSFFSPGGGSLNEEPPLWRIGRWNLLMPYTITIVLFQKTLEKERGGSQWTTPSLGINQCARQRTDILFISTFGENFRKNLLSFGNYCISFSKKMGGSPGEEPPNRQSIWKHGTLQLILVLFSETLAKKWATYKGRPRVTLWKNW
jgi:hypothetical protein